MQQTLLLIFFPEKQRTELADKSWFAVGGQHEGGLFQEVPTVEEGTILWAALRGPLPYPSWKCKNLAVWRAVRTAEEGGHALVSKYPESLLFRALFIVVD